MARKAKSRAAPSAKTKYVFRFEEGSIRMKDLLGGKGAGLAEMTRIGVTVPPGFTITTEACNEYQKRGEKFLDSIWEQIARNVALLEKRTGKTFGSEENPLLVSVRSGAKFSMPGMMDTILNLGLNDRSAEGLARRTGNERFAFDAYRRFIQMFSSIVLDIPKGEFEKVFDEEKHRRGAVHDTDLDAPALREVVARYRETAQAKAGREFPQDPWEQLRLAIVAVFQSWNNPRAITYRTKYRIPHHLGTAVNIQTMAFGNTGPKSGTGVAFTRNPATGARELYGEFLINAQGEDVVAGIRTPRKIAELQQEMPPIYRQLTAIGERLEHHMKDMQDIEFTIEDDRLYILQCRNGKRTGIAAVKIAVDMAREKLITREEALLRVVQQGGDPHPLAVFLAPVFDPREKEQAVQAKRYLARGINASPGAATGRIVLTSERAREETEAGRGPVILVREETNPDDLPGMIAAHGILTSRGGATSHAAVVARGMGKPCVAGCGDLRIDHNAGTATAAGRTLREGDPVSIDGFSGQVFEGTIRTLDSAVIRRLRSEKLTPEEQGLAEYFDTFLDWADTHRRGKLGVWANADMPQDAILARRLGAEGIGLCRTEHMFLGERTAIVQKMVMAETPEERREVLTRELLPLQRQDFQGILEAMDGLPVIIRLLDPPLHEFMPNIIQLEVEVALLRERGDSPALQQKEALLHKVRALHEFNPMLGLRVCRLGIVYPEIYETQARAIFEAAAALRQQKKNPRPHVMVPGVGHANEMKFLRQLLDRVHHQVETETGTKIPTKIGTMIEIPRACIIARDLARDADFFSFGTNDLTQMTWAYSRDDAEGKFLPHYIQKGILEENPFATLDTEGVGALMTQAARLGRETRPDISLGICGEHGGDPASIQFCYTLGLNYVSCSPYRIPVARLAAAQAVVSEKAKGGSDQR